MVASATLSSTKSTPLSYADRAKHVKAPNQPSLRGPNGITAVAGSSYTLINSADSPKLAATVDRPASPTAADTKVNSAPSSRQDLRQSASPSRTMDAVSNGDVSTTSSITGRPPAMDVAPSLTSTKLPPVNVWNIRKEQMAQANSYSRAPLSSAQNYSSSNSIADFKTTIGASTKEAAVHQMPPANGAPNFSENDDPFIIRSRSQGLLPIDDQDSWPDVGSSLQSTVNQNSKELKDGNEKSERDKLRKGEKPKWVQIPPSELQAAADEARSQAHLRNPSSSRQDRSVRNHTASAAGSSSGSAIASRRSSRAQSVQTSTSQSRVQSRTGSTHTSPRQFTKPKLPAENDVSEVPPPHSLNDSSSRINSSIQHVNSRVPHGDMSQSSYGIDQSVTYDVTNNTNQLPAQSLRRHNFDHSGSPPQYPYPSGANGYASKLTSQSSTLLHSNIFPYGGYQYGNHQYQYWDESSPETPQQAYPLSQVPPEVDDGRIQSLTTFSHPSPADDSGTSGEYQPRPVLPPVDVSRGADRGRKGRNMVFGTIEPLRSNEVLIPPTSERKTANPTVEKSAEEAALKAFSAFTIGIPPSDLEISRRRSRTSSKAGKQGDITSPLEKNSDVEPHKPVIDLTGPKWEFGTATSVDPDNANSSSQLPDDVPLEPANQSPPLSISTNTLVRHEPRFEGDDEWEVRDFGYGFGSMSGTGRAPAVVREEMLARERQRAQERELDRERERELERERTVVEGDTREKDREFGRPRRGSLTSDRGGLIPRRGRGGGSGSGRGYGPRNFSRGYQGHPRQQPPFTVTPPNHFQQLPPQGYPSEPSNPGYYIPQPNYSPYGVGYDVYAYAPYVPAAAVAPPVPAPLSPLSFPLDPTRYYLLGQLEYYLSPQNMAQDFYLRKQMDPQGWISIPLLASFNRVRQLTTDIQLVREVITLSSTLEVNGDWVRMAGQLWKQFLLPNTTNSENEQHTGQIEDDLQASEDEEEEVEFVMG